MEDQQIADELLSLVTQLLEAAGPEWTIAALQALIEEAGAGGGGMEPEVMSQGGPSAMPSRQAGPPKMMNAFATKQ